LDEIRVRIALHSIIREGAETDYEKTHEAVPQGLMDSFDRFGISSWTIWRSGRDLFHVVVADDYDAADALLADDPANAEWQAMIGPFVDRFVGGQDGGGGPLRQVWDFESQKRHGRAREEGGTR
jgi:L-rhamnose mutarotase